MSKNKNGNRMKRSKSFWKGPVFWGLVIVLASVVFGGGYWLHTLWSEIYQEVQNGRDGLNSFIGRNGDNVSTPGDSSEREERESLPDIMTVLVLGLDGRGSNMTGRTDTLMLLTLNKKSNEINIVSIPRDMRVEIPGYGLDKINHAHAYGEVALTRQAVEDFLDARVDYYVTTNFEGFKNIVDILGGVELEVESRMRYYGIDVTIELDPGLQTLDGDKALQYVRYRSDGQGDLGRVERQQKLLSVLIEDVLTFWNILKFPRLMPEIARNVKTDLELSQAITLANRIKGIDIEEINTATLPGSHTMINGVSYLIPKEDEIRDKVDRYIKGKEEIEEEEVKEAAAEPL